MLIWVTGISGTGKTTIARKLFDRVKTRLSPIIYLDGDEFRNAMGGDLGFTLVDRDKNAIRMTRMCKLLCEQGINVICGANLTSQRFRDWCATEIPEYYEIYVEVPINVLMERDTKNLYKSAIEGTKKDVVGVNIPFTRPHNPFLIIDNSRSGLESIDNLVDKIVDGVGI